MSEKEFNQLMGNTMINSSESISPTNNAITKASIRINPEYGTRIIEYIPMEFPAYSGHDIDGKAIRVPAYVRLVPVTYNKSRKAGGVLKTLKDMMLQQKNRKI